MPKSSPKKQPAGEPEVLTLGEHVEKATAPKRVMETISQAAPKEKKPSKKDSEIVALRREVKALRQHQAEERRLAGEVQAAELDLDGANSERSAAKERLAEANKRLATFVRGEPVRDVETGKQEQFIADKDKPKGTVSTVLDPTRDGAAAQKAGKKLGDNPWKGDAPERRLWDAGYLGAKWNGVPEQRAIKWGLFFPVLVNASITGDCLTPGEKAPKVEAVPGGGHMWLVVDAWKASESGTARFAVVQLLAKTDYMDLWRGKYGPPVKGVDTSDEAKAQRVLGGVDCARFVTVGKKQFVVGPMEASMVLTVAEEDMPKAGAAAKVDHQAKAAGDDATDTTDEG